MRKISLVLVLIFISMGMTAQFRNTTWGMSKAEVKNVETQIFLQKVDEEMDMYQPVKLNNKNYYLGYRFDSGKLTGGIYLIQEGEEAFKLKPHFNKIVQLLCEKYGVSDTSEEVWDDLSYKELFSNNDGKLMWVDQGKLHYYFSFDTEDTRISTFLKGEDSGYSSSITVLYFDLKSMDSIDEKEKDKDKSNL